MRAILQVMAAAVLAVAALAIAVLGLIADLRSDLRHRGSPVASSCPDALEARYFPIGMLMLVPMPNGDDSYARRRYSSYLAAMEEPSLSCGSLEDTEAYRFLWVGSHSVAVRLFRRGDVYGLEAVILDDMFWEGHLRWLWRGTGDHKPGKVTRHVTKALSPDQWRTLIARLEEMQFWSMATFRAVVAGTDAATWMVEGRRGGRYRVVKRWGGTDGLESVGPLFLGLAGATEVGPIY